MCFLEIFIAYSEAKVTFKFEKWVHLQVLRKYHYF